MCKALCAIEIETVNKKEYMVLKVYDSNACVICVATNNNKTPYFMEYWTTNFLEVDNDVIVNKFMKLYNK